MLSLSHKIALVGGASQGIGRACAIVLAEQGAQVIALARTEEKLIELCAALKKINPVAHDFIACDMNDLAHLEKKVKEKMEQYGAIEILIHNTGGPRPGAIVNATTEDFLSAFRQHVMTAHLLTELLLPGMREKKYGRIINITSTSVKCPIPNLGVSNTTRWAMTGWAKTMALELAKDYITVNNVLPGMTDTARIQHRFEQRAKEKNISLEAAKAEILQTIPMQRLAEPREIANVVAFLASPAASYVTGTAMPVDGGLTPAV